MITHEPNKVVQTYKKMTLFKIGMWEESFPNARWRGLPRRKGKGCRARQIISILYNSGSCEKELKVNKLIEL